MKIECDFSKLGQAAVAARILADITQNELAERMGVHHTQICRWENNKYKGASIGNVAKVFAALELEVTLIVPPKPQEKSR